MNRFVFLCLFLSIAGATMDAQTLNVTEHILKNGLKIILQEDHTVPSVCYYTFFKAGGRTERPGITGISHLFEHMMFNGSAKYAPMMFDRIIESGGGYSNGSTWNDFTNYWEEFNPDILETILDMEADRMRALRVDAANLEQERGIVMEERRLSVDNNVTAKMYEELYAAAFVASMYHFPVIGWMKDIENITLDDAKKYYRTFYAPNNAVVIITGDFNSDRVMELMEKKFGDIPSQEPPQRVIDAEPPQEGEKRVELHKVAELPAVAIAYKGAAATDSDFYALDLLATILSRGESSRLYRTIIYEKQLVADVSASNDEFIDPGLFIIYAQMRPGKTTSEAEKEIYSIIADIQQNGVSDTELQKAKNAVQADYVRRLETNQGRGFLLGFYEVVHGDYHVMFDVLNNYNAVTRADVQRVAKKYLTDRNRTVVTLFPEKPEETAATH